MMGERGRPEAVRTLRECLSRARDEDRRALRELGTPARSGTHSVELVEEAALRLPAALGVEPDPEGATLVREMVGTVGEVMARELLDREMAGVRERFALLRRIRRVLASSTEIEDALSVAARMTVPALADACLVDLVEAGTGSSRHLRRHDVMVDTSLPNSRTIADALRANPPHPHAPHGSPLAALAGESTLLREVPDEVLAAEARDARHLEVLKRISPASYLCVPVPAGPTPIGAITFLSLTHERRFGEPDRDMAEELAARCGLVALHTARGEANPVIGDETPLTMPPQKEPAPLRDAATDERILAIRAGSSPAPPHPTSCPPPSLTPRQLEVLALLAAACTNDQIACSLHVSTHTVKHHVKTILKAFGVRRRYEAVKLALEYGMVPPTRIGPLLAEGANDNGRRTRATRRRDPRR